MERAGFAALVGLLPVEPAFGFLRGAGMKQACGLATGNDKTSVLGCLSGVEVPRLFKSTLCSTACDAQDCEPREISTALAHATWLPLPPILPKAFQVIKHPSRSCLIILIHVKPLISGLAVLLSCCGCSCRCFRATYLSFSGLSCFGRAVFCGRGV